MLSATVMDNHVNDPLAKIVQKIHYLTQSNNLQVLAINSEKQKEGKSHFVFMLAKQLHKIYGVRVAIFDSNLEGDDLLNSVLKGREGKSGTYSQVMKGVDVVQVKDIVLKVERSHVDTLFFNRIVEELKSDYPIILIDTVSANNEGRSSFNLKVDGHLLVTSKKSVNGKFEQSVEKYHNSNSAPLVGVLYNEFEV